jgi:biopolymer transport protein ExbD
MNFGRARPREEPEINFIPLIDVLLVILIFLMVTTTYSKFTELQVNLPSASGEAGGERPAEIIVGVSAEGQFLVDREIVTARDAMALARQIQRAAKDKKDPTVIVHADAGATHQSVVQVLEAARMAGLPRVSFAAQASGTATK